MLIHSCRTLYHFSDGRYSSKTRACLSPGSQKKAALTAKCHNPLAPFKYHLSQQVVSVLQVITYEGIVKQQKMCCYIYVWRSRFGLYMVRGYRPQYWYLKWYNTRISIPVDHSEELIKEYWPCCISCAALSCSNYCASTFSLSSSC